ncbi:metallophosphoesterase [Streptomyces sp. NPDC000880]
MTTSRTKTAIAVMTAVFAAMMPVTAAADSENGGSAPRSNDAFSFGLIADIQYWNGPGNGTRYYADSPAKLTEAAKTINGAGVDFSVQVGDIIDRDARSFDEILPVWEQFEGPRYNVLGNHDFPGMYSDEVVAKLGMSNEYYDWTHQNWRFVVLDTTDISLFANAPGSADYKKAEKTLAELQKQGAVNAQSWNGGVGKRQLGWLADVLDDAEAKDQRVIVFGHNPVNGENAHNAWDAPAVRKVLESHDNVAAYFNGHDHAGRYAFENGIHYVNLKGMVENPLPANAYSVVTVRNDEIRIDGYGNEPDRVLTVD